ncbi:putative ribonuclease H-like domain-containing protein [Tanacetum coccineum]
MKAFDQVDQLEMEEMDLKWQMAMLSLRINRFEKKAGRKMNYNNQQPARFDRRKVRCTEVKTGRSKSFVSVDSMVNWSDMAAENTMVQLRRFAMMGISPRVLGVDEVFELSHTSVFYSDPVRGRLNLYTSRLSGWGMVLDVPTSITGNLYARPYQSDIAETSETSLQGLWTHASCDSKPQDPDQKTSLLLLYPDFCTESDVKTQIPLTGDKLHLIKDCDFYNCVDSLPCKSKAASVPAGSRNSSASVPADRSDHAASRNRPAVNPADRPHPGVGQKSATVSAAVRWGTACYVLSRFLGGIHDKILGLTRVMVDSSIHMVSPLNDHKAVQVRIGLEFQLPDASQVVLRIPRKHDLYTFHISDLQPEQKVTCFVAKASLDESTRWHRRMAHVNFKTINKLAKEGLVDGLPLKVFTNEHNCVACNKGKQHKASYKHISAVRLITDTLQLLHMDLFGPTNIRRYSINNPHISYPTDELISGKGKADDGYLVGYASNSKAYRVYNLPHKRVEETLNLRFLEDKPNVQGIGHEWYFDLDYLTDSLGYTRFKTDTPAGTHETNINAGTQDHDSDSEVDEQVIVIPSFPSNRFAAKDAAARYGYLFSQATAEILCQAEAKIRDQGVSAVKDPAGVDSAVKDPAGVDSAVKDSAGVDSADGCISGFPSADSDPAVGNPADSFPPAGRVEPTDESNPAVSSSVSADFHPVYADESTLPPGQQLGSTPAVEVNPVPTKRVNTIHPQSQILGDLASPVMTRSRAQKSKFGEICKALEDPDWVDAMQEEMQQFINQQVWKLVPLPVGKHAIGTKWILKNKRDARGIVVRNKARLVAQGHRQEEGIDYDELDVKSAFLYGEIEEEVYHLEAGMQIVLLFCCKQIQRVTIGQGTLHHEDSGYNFGTVYVDDIIFGSTNKAWCDEFEVLMKGEFEMSAMGEMTFFLGLQVKQLPDGLFISQDKYVKDMLTKFDMESVRTDNIHPMDVCKTKLKDETDPPVNVHLYRSMIGSLMYLTASRPDIMFAVSACSRHQVTPLTSHLNAVKKIFKYLKGQPKLGLWYPKDSPFQLEAYSDSDYAGSHGDRKSTTGGCQFLGRRLISWQCKKQTIVATSSTEAEYVAAASCCAQVLWIQNQLLDYGFNFMNTKIFIDNQSTICIVKNPVFHQRTKHIEIRHHFIRDANEKNLIQVLKIHTDDNVADLLTKAFDGPRFAYLVVHIGMVDMMLVSAGCTMVLLVVILPAGRMVSAGWSMVLLVVIFPAARLVSAGCTMVLLVVIFPAGRLVSAGCTMVLLVVIFSADWFLLVVLWFCWKLLFLLDSLFLLVAMGYAAGRFISADRVFVPAVYMVSAVG